MKEAEQGRKPVQGSLAFAELASTDPATTRKFLEEVFGWKFDSVQIPNGQYLTHQEPDGNRIGIRPAQPTEIPSSMNYVRVENLNVAMEKVRALRGEIVLPRTDIPNMGSFFWFRIPNGPIMACWQDAPNNRSVKRHKQSPGQA